MPSFRRNDWRLYDKYISDNLNGPIDGTFKDIREDYTPKVKKKNLPTNLPVGWEYQEH
ncbi:MAG: hypothetical protein ABI325_10650 [Ginsengibacter sp.]